MTYRNGLAAVDDEALTRHLFDLARRRRLHGDDLTFGKREYLAADLDEQSPKQRGGDRQPQDESRAAAVRRLHVDRAAEPL